MKKFEVNSLQVRLSLCLAISSILIIAYLSIGISFGSINFDSEYAISITRMSLVHCILLGYSLFALMQLTTSKHIVRQTISPYLNRDVSDIKDLADTPLFWIIGSLFASVIAFAAPYISTTTPWDISTLSYSTSWHRTLAFAISLLLTLFVFSMVAHSLYLSRLTTLFRRINLLNMAPFEPLVNQGKHQALLCVGAASVTALFIIEDSQIIMATIVGILMFLAMIIGLLLPLSGAHHLIKQAKSNEIQLINEQLQACSERDMDQQDYILMRAQLAAYKTHIEDLPNWPITLKTWIKVMSFISAPFISWGIGYLLQIFITRGL